MRADAAENAEYALDEQGRLNDTAVEEVLGHVEMADVVALDLEPRAIRGTRGQDVFDVLERVLEDAIVGTGEVRSFPVELELGKTSEHRKQAEVHRPHVERRHLRLQLQ